MRWLITHSYLYGYGQLAAARLALRDPDASERQRLAEELGIFAGEGQQRLQQHLSETGRALAALRDEANSRGDTLMVALAPPVFAVDERRAGPTLRMVGLEDADPDAPRLALLQLLELHRLVAPRGAGSGSGSSVGKTSVGMMAALYS